MKTQFIFLAAAALILGTACGSSSKDQSAESAQAPAPVVAPAAPAPTPEAATTDMQACEGKAAKDPCTYTGDKGEVKGACVRTESQALQCQVKKSKKK
ncbi:hypothetical protein [Bdellovibrio sp. HCB337]|uniref:hypothetical protein n=1 Tax=Bdellovibrio sp. HCB337 TaxID=3394358 RepID=UPI0039A50B79